MTKHKTIRTNQVLAVSAMLLLNAVMPICAAMPVQGQIPFKGTLVNEPCTIVTGTDGDNVVVDFNAIPDKNFYSSNDGRSQSESFHITLQDCDLTLGSKVKVTFAGTPDSEQPDLLALNSGASSATHVAVAITTSADLLIPINKQTDGYLLQNGSTTLNFNAYLQASRNALINHSIGVGDVSAIATFTLEYL